MAHASSSWQPIYGPPASTGRVDRCASRSPPTCPSSPTPTATRPTRPSCCSTAAARRVTRGTTRRASSAHRAGTHSPSTCVVTVTATGRPTVITRSRSTHGTCRPWRGRCRRSRPWWVRRSGGWRACSPWARLAATSPAGSSSSTSRRGGDGGCGAHPGVHASGPRWLRRSRRGGRRHRLVQPSSPAPEGPLGPHEEPPAQGGRTLVLALGPPVHGAPGARLRRHRRSARSADGGAGTSGGRRPRGSGCRRCSCAARRAIC